MNLLHTEQFKHRLSGDAVNNFKSYKGETLSSAQRLDRLEKKLNTVINSLLVVFVCIIAVLLTR